MESAKERKLIKALKKRLRPRLRKRIGHMITLQAAIKLNGVEDWDLNPEEQDFLLQSTQELVQRHGKDWVSKNQRPLQESLQEALNLL